MTPILALLDAPSEAEPRNAPLVQRLFAPFARWPFRLVVLLVLLPLLLARYSQAEVGVLLVSATLQLLVAMPVIALADGVRRRAQAAVTVGDAGRLAEVNGTAAMLAIVAAVLLELLWWLSAPFLADLLTVEPGQTRAATLSLLQNEAMQVASWPLLVTSLAMAEALLSEGNRSTVRGAVVLMEAMTVLVVPITGLGLSAWPVLHTGAHLWVIAILIGVIQRAGGAPLQLRFARSEVGALWHGRNGAVVPEPGFAPGCYAATVIGAAALRPSAAVVPAASVLAVAGLMAVGWQLASHLEPIDAIIDLHADAYRARWRFRRALDAALLVALGLALPIAFYGETALEAWLGVGKQSSAPLVALAAFVLVSAPVAVCGQWLRRANRAHKVAGVRALEIALAVPLSVICWVYAGWTAAAWSLVFARVVTTVLSFLRSVARHLGTSALQLAFEQVWRMALVALPSTLTALCFILFKPPRNAREWTIQVIIVAILFVIPAFAAWSLMDTRKDDA